MSNNDEPPKRSYTLDGRPVDDAALPESWGRSAPRVGRVGDWNNDSGRASPSGSRVAGLGDISRDPPRRRQDQEGAELYAGGERSGLAVQNPDGPARPDGPGSTGRHGGSARSMVEDILQQAMSSGPPSRSSPAPRDAWSSVGHTLGSDEQESTTVGEAPAAPSTDEVQQRTLTFWRDGFSIEDGELYRYDAPGNQELLAAIHAGRAPVSLFNVSYDQPLELVVQQRTGEDYKPAPKVSKPFSGGGNRLGSPVPAVAGAGSSSSSTAAAPTPAASTPAATATPSITVDASKPATSVQLRLADGSRLVARVNLDHTVADLRAYVAASRPDPRPFILQTTFPSRELKDAETVAEAKLANAVVVQRYT
ncbi:UBX domain-containing protein 3 [Vanrija pseudolonga]|uniref:UBX domain-containing protein 3 n=1 Tax=Vanrija pseudolonga TaxID=143232 RepID=A0AAF1BHC4_9TREE|nr:UBX domain-containing protein 3 [Vanrija pseudolonga]